MRGFSFRKMSIKSNSSITEIISFRLVVFTLSDEELLFGKSLNTIDQLQRSPLLKKLNYCMLLAKYYLYNQKLNQIEPELNEFKNRLNLQYRE